MSLVLPIEHVLVIPTALFHSMGYFQGFQRDAERTMSALLDPAHTSWRPRDEVEQDPSWKQLIPYVLFEFDGPGGLQLFRYTRGSGQGEKRLHARKSVGVGGHISSHDQESGCAYQQGMKRELDEEVILDTTSTIHCAGLINDDDTDVGKVHLGIVHICKVEQPAVRAREADICDAGFADLATIHGELELYESWSRICLEALYPVSKTP